MTDQVASEKRSSQEESIWPIPTVYLLHSKGGSPNGTVRRLASVLELHWPGLDFLRPELPHSESESPAEYSVEHLLRLEIPRGSLIMGISLGGTVAATLQENGRTDLKVIAISSPTCADGVILEVRGNHRLAFYSSRDEVISSRVGAWPRLASFWRDFDWLSHDTDQHLRAVTRLFDWYLEGTVLTKIDTVASASMTRSEGDEIVWKTMTDELRRPSAWREGPRNGDFPQTFREIGTAVRSGAEWESAWNGWSHALMFRKDARCFAEEPPEWFPPERRAMMAGAAEFLAKLYGLPVPAWIERPEYFLPEPDYYGCVISVPGSEPGLLLPETEEAEYRLRARTPKEMLRRNVIFAARNLTTC